MRHGRAIVNNMQDNAADIKAVGFVAEPAPDALFGLHTLLAHACVLQNQRECSLRALCRKALTLPDANGARRIERL